MSDNKSKNNQSFLLKTPQYRNKTCDIQLSRYFDWFIRVREILYDSKLSWYQSATTYEHAVTDNYEIIHFCQKKVYSITAPLVSYQYLHHIIGDDQVISLVFYFLDNFNFLTWSPNQWSSTSSWWNLKETTIIRRNISHNEINPSWQFGNIYFDIDTYLGRNLIAIEYTFLRKIKSMNSRFRRTLRCNKLIQWGQKLHCNTFNSKRSKPTDFYKMK